MLIAAFQMVADISIHAPREGGDGSDAGRHYQPRLISIHAPREGGDGRLPLHRGRIRISIHAPREGGDGHGGLVGRQRKGFQSTPPARGAT